jgi:hypothetical protein
MRIKIDYKQFGERCGLVVIAEEFTIPGVTGHQFAVHNNPDFPGLYAATHVGTGFAVGRGSTPEEAIEMARTKWLEHGAESLSLKLIRAKNLNRIDKPAVSPDVLPA